MKRIYNGLCVFILSFLLLRLHRLLQELLLQLQLLLIRQILLLLL